MEKKEKVSIIVPVYNAENFIEETIECVFNQTYSNFELILVDDCSTDKSAEIIKNIKDKRVIYLKNEKKLRSSHFKK